MSFRFKQAGLSLLELLVVFVIVGMVSTLLMQGLGFGLSLFDRVHSRSESVRQELLVRQWFRQVNQSLVARLDANIPSLRGDSISFEASTLNPLLGEPGVLRQVRWSIEEDALWYEEAGSQLRIAALDSTAELRYRNRYGLWFSEWPVNEDVELLPQGISIESALTQPIVSVLRVRDDPDILLEESRRERE